MKIKYTILHDSSKAAIDMKKFMQEQGIKHRSIYGKNYTKIISTEYGVYRETNFSGFKALIKEINTPKYKSLEGSLIDLPILKNLN